MLLMGGRGGGAAATFIQILKTVVRIGDAALDKSVPTPFPSASTLAHKPSFVHFYKFGIKVASAPPPTFPFGNINN